MNEATERKAPWRPYATMVLALAMGVAATGINLWAATVMTRERRVHPTIAGIDDLLLLAIALTVPWTILRLWRARSRWLRAIAIVVVQCAIFVGCFVSIFRADPHFMDDSHVDSLARPDGEGDVHLYRWSFICGYSLYERASWSPVLHRVDTLPRDDCRGAQPTLAWRGGKATVIDAAGEPLEPEYWDLFAWLRFD